MFQCLFPPTADHLALAETVVEHQPEAEQRLQVELELIPLVDQRPEVQALRLLVANKLEELELIPLVDQRLEVQALRLLQANLLKSLVEMVLRLLLAKSLAALNKLQAPSQRMVALKHQQEDLRLVVPENQQVRMVDRLNLLLVPKEQKLAKSLPDKQGKLQDKKLVPLRLLDKKELLH